MHRDGAPLAMVPNGKEKRFARWKAMPCGDCGVAVGAFHHLGCDMQECPRCSRQMMCCGCWFDEDGVAIADDEEMWEDFVDDHMPAGQ